MTSNKTNQEIKSVLNKYLSQNDQEKLFQDLSNIKGNQSFKDSISNLLKIIQNEKITNA